MTDKSEQLLAMLLEILEVKFNPRYADQFYSLTDKYITLLTKVY